MLDILVIGAGPIGIACGLAAKKKNLNYLIIEKGSLVNSLFHYPVNMTFFSTSEKLEIEDIPFISNNNKPTKQEALEYYRRITSSNNLKINLYEEVISVEKNENFTILTNVKTYKAKNVVIATGFFDTPNLLNVKGENLPKVRHYYYDPHEYAFMKTIVVGASNSSVDAALEIYRKGGDVTMVIRGKSIGERVKYWVRPDIINRIEEGNIKVIYSAEIEKIEPKKVIVKTSEGIQTLENDYVLALTGYRPNLHFLKEIGIEIQANGNQKTVYNEETMETNIKGVYLAGVICGGLETHKWFIENSRIHATKIVEDVVNSK